ncbi:hypothetical protein LXL04_001119 [Taraxacum kok-saghyz]
MPSSLTRRLIGFPSLTFSRKHRSRPHSRPSMVTLVVATTIDPASIESASALLAMPGWHPVHFSRFTSTSTSSSILFYFSDMASFVNKEVRLLKMDNSTVREDHLDKRWESATGEVVNEVIFLSRHIAASKRPALTIHPIGIRLNLIYNRIMSIVTGFAQSATIYVLVVSYPNVTGRGESYARSGVEKGQQNREADGRYWYTVSERTEMSLPPLVPNFRDLANCDPVPRVPHLREDEVPPSGGKSGCAAPPNTRMGPWLRLLKIIAESHNLTPEFEACLLPTPKGRSCGNYARCVNQILQNLNNMQLWLRIPLEKSDGDDDAVNGVTDRMAVDLSDSWELWNSFRVLCEHHSQLSVALDVLSSLPSPNSLGRWIGEPVKSAILQTDSFLTNARGYPCLSKRHQNLLSSFFYYSVQIVLSGKAVHKVAASGATQPDAQQAQRHELRSYLESLPEQKRFEPLMDNLEAQAYETFEKDSVKYIQYQRAVSKALLDRISDENASTTTVVLGKDLLLEHHYRYTSFIQPVTTSKLYNDVKLHKDLLHFETAYVVKLHRLAKLSPSQSGLLRKLNKQEERMCKVRDLSSSMFFLQRLF